MKILHAVESYYPAVGGMPEVVRRLSEGLVQLGHDVTVATSHTPERRSDLLNGVKIESFSLSGRLADGIIGTPAEQERYRQFISEKTFDIVTFFAAQQWSCDLAFPILNSMPAEKIFVPTGFSALNNPAFAQYYDKMKDWLRGFDMIVFLSNDYQDINFARCHGIDKCMIIPNGASESEFSTKSTFNFRREKALPEDTKIMLLVGSHTGDKGHHEAIRILKSLRSTNVALVIAANIPNGMMEIAMPRNWQSRLKRIVKRILSPVNHRFRKQLLCPAGCLHEAKKFNATRKARKQKKWLFVDSFSREQVIALYQQADLFLFPSNIECSPIVLFEALAGKTPFLASNAGNSSEIAEWTQGGIILPCRPRPDGRTEVIISEAVKITDALLSDDIERTRLAANGHKAWLEKFTWEGIIQQYSELYSRLITGETE